MSSSKFPTDELVRSGALTVSQGHQLTLDRDGLLIVTSVDPKRTISRTPEQQRLNNIIQFLESPVSPKSVDWIRAREAFCQLRDQDVSREGDADIMAWHIADEAHRFTIQHFDLLENLLELLEAKKLDADRLSQMHEVARYFPEHACRLVGISTLDYLNEDAWDDYLAEMVLESNITAYRCINDAWVALRDGQQRGFLGSSTEPERHLRRFLDLDSIKTLKKWMDHDVFVILKRKVITTRRLRQP
ncbi:hypothetical protein NCS52_00711900 [Fusarium sp. LHS14.1]|nr:hypothetical protein NCS52_00711900 [Fusarium sp. LHS14.1]